MNISSEKSMYNSQKTLAHSPSFGARLTPQIKAAEQVVKDLAGKGWQSSTFFEDVRYVPKKFMNHEHRALAMLKIAEIKSMIFAYRRAMLNLFQFSDENEAGSWLRKVVDRLRVLNCGEAAIIVGRELEKKGIPSRVVADKSIDHCFVVANRSEPFTNYRSAQKDNFVVDLWMKKIYKSVEEAYTDFKRRFAAKIDDSIVDRTGQSDYCCINTRVADSNSMLNDSVLEKLVQSSDKVRSSAVKERLQIPNQIVRIEQKINGRLVEEYLEDFNNQITV